MGSAFHCRGAAVKIWGGFEFLEEERGAREEVIREGKCHGVSVS